MPDKIRCNYCSNDITSDYYRILLDGTRLHEKCYLFIENPGREYHLKIDKLYKAIQDKRWKVNSELYSRTFFQKLFSVETEQYKALKKAYDQLIIDHKKLLEESSSYKLEKWIEFEKYYDYWPERPPDWEARSHAIRNKIGKCKKCERKPTKKRKLHAHHIIPISDGGNHLETNLRVLCNYCHKKEHKHKFGRNFSTNNRGLQNTLRKVEKTIHSGGILNFQYDSGQKPLLSYSIKPLNITYINGVSVRGIDTELGNKKVFSLKRMKFKDPHRKDNFYLLKKALNQDLLIHCVYTNLDGGKSERTLKPINFTEFKNSRVIDCYDYLREARRSFNLSRMKSIRLVDKPGLQRRLD